MKLFDIGRLDISFENIILQEKYRVLFDKTVLENADKSTTKEGISGGIGLALLKEFIEKNKGKMQIVSNDGFYQFGYEGEILKQFHGQSPGTIVNLQFRTDDRSNYSLKSEININDIF
ncbi:MAG: hypothetical protein Q8910_10965 [Bacteroidota bacterium]|nr:hypothetical protein [Bacteroidota bacterium]